MEHAAALTCDGISGDKTNTFPPPHPVQIELVAAGRQQPRNSHCAGPTVHSKCLWLALCIPVLHREGVKSAFKDIPFQLDSGGCHVGGRELAQTRPVWWFLL